MTATVLLYNPLVPATATASTEAAGYPATNALDSQILKPWKGTANSFDYLQIDLGSSKAVTGVTITGANMPFVFVYADNSATPTTSRGTLTMAADDQGRYKGSLQFSATVRYIRFSISPNATLDGAPGWIIGAATAWAASFSPPRDPLYGGSSLDFNSPQSRQDLDNGVVIRDDIGPSYQLITLAFSGSASDDMAAIRRCARAGLCWLDLGVSTQRGWQWPVREHEAKVTRKITGFNRETMDLVLKEEV